MKVQKQFFGSNFVWRYSRIFVRSLKRIILLNNFTWLLALLSLWKVTYKELQTKSFKSFIIFIWISAWRQLLTIKIYLKISTKDNQLKSLMIFGSCFYWSDSNIQGWLYHDNLPSNNHCKPHGPLHQPLWLWALWAGHRGQPDHHAGPHNNVNRHSQRLWKINWLLHGSGLAGCKENEQFWIIFKHKKSPQDSHTIGGPPCHPCRSIHFGTFFYFSEPFHAYPSKCLNYSAWQCHFYKFS